MVFLYYEELCHCINDTAVLQSPDAPVSNFGLHGCSGSPSTQPTHQPDHTASREYLEVLYTQINLTLDAE